MIRKNKIRDFAQNLLKKDRDYQPGRTDRGDFKKALLYIMELTEPNNKCKYCKHFVSYADIYYDELEPDDIGE